MPAYAVKRNRTQGNAASLCQNNIASIGRTYKIGVHKKSAEAAPSA
jgi:hypothetical protein